MKSGALSGTVTDETGAPVEEARVQVLAVDPIVVGQVVFTGAEGRFSLPAASRKYRVVVTAEGYESVSVEDITVTVDQTTTVDVRLEK